VADLYDVLDEVVDANKPTMASLVEHCTNLLAGPMPDDAWDRLRSALSEIESRSTL
jgi:hypothetical protein